MTVPLHNSVGETCFGGTFARGEASPGRWGLFHVATGTWTWSHGKSTVLDVTTLKQPIRNAVYDLL